MHDVYARPLYGNKGGRAALLQRSLLDSAQLLQRLHLETKLDVHTGCVNTIGRLVGWLVQETLWL